MAACFHPLMAAFSSSADPAPNYDDREDCDFRRGMKMPPLMAMWQQRVDYFYARYTETTADKK